MTGAKPTQGRRAKQSGAATLVVVLVLFFIMALMAAYAGRSLIFEQKTSANQYRSTQAFEAAQAGLGWAMAQLSGGRIDGSCVASTAVSDSTFRDRYLETDNSGVYTRRSWSSGTSMTPLRASCVRAVDGGLNCSCPSGGAPDLTATASAGAYPAFQVEFRNVAQPGMVEIRSTGCTSWNPDCLLAGQGTVSGEGAAIVTAMVALTHGLVTPPVAALTVRESLDIGTTPLHLHNTDPGRSGITLDVGRSVNATQMQLLTVPGGSPLASIVDGDASLQALSADQMFAATFGMARNSFKRQPAAVVLTDCSLACAARLETTAQTHPNSVIWVEGDLNIERDVALGSVDQPVLLVVNGNINFASAGIRVVGVVYSQAPTWAHTGAAGVIVGAAIAENRFTGSGELVVQYDAAVVRNVNLRLGSLVFVPGSWKDFF